MSTNLNNSGVRADPFLARQFVTENFLVVRGAPRSIFLGRYLLSVKLRAVNCVNEFLVAIFIYRVELDSHFRVHVVLKGNSDGIAQRGLYE